jgi:chromosome segregation ATPase
VRQVKESGEAEADLERTDELPTLDVAAYEAGLAQQNPHHELTGADASNTAWEESHPQPAGPPPAETLQDIEAWIAAQGARARASEHLAAEAQAGRAEAEARADNLTLAVEVTRNSLHTALCRANEAERAALDNRAAADTAESRGAELRAELEQARRERALTEERIVAVTQELAQTRGSLAASARQQDEMQQRQSELGRALDERSTRVAQLDGELARLRTHIAEADSELAQRGERIAALRDANETQQALAGTLAGEREALAMRLASVGEIAQSNEWKRSVCESVWHELDTELTETRALLARSEAERTALGAIIDQTHAELAARDTSIASLETNRSAQVTAYAELATQRVREQQDHALSAREASVRAENLNSEIKALAEQEQRRAESDAARDAQLVELRNAHSILEETLRTVRSDDSARAVRVAELDGLANDLKQALQAQTEATGRANALLDARERELASERVHVGALETQLQASVQLAAERSAASQLAEVALRRHLEELAASRDRLAETERAAASQSERLASLQVELARAEGMADQAETLRRLVENELELARSELQREAKRAGTLDTAQRELALELERTRGALGERDLQLRRLERYATSSAQVLGRIKAGIERGDSKALSEILQPADDSATLVPLDDSDAAPLVLGSRTTIGRAPESNLCLKDSSISRRHAVVTIGSRGAFIEDIHSVNGVTVNRRRIRHARLADGDVIELGLKRFRFTVPPRQSADSGQTIS